jgi:hypothetical protein
MKLEVIPGTGCSAIFESRVSGNQGETVIAEVELNCEHCGLCEPLSAQGDVDSVLNKIQGEGKATLMFQCRNLDVQGFDIDAIPEGFFPTIVIAES